MGKGVVVALCLDAEESERFVDPDLSVSMMVINLILFHDYESGKNEVYIVLERDAFDWNVYMPRWIPLLPENGMEI